MVSLYYFFGGSKRSKLCGLEALGCVCMCGQRYGMWFKVQSSDFILGLLIVCNIHFLGHSLAYIFFFFLMYFTYLILTFYILFKKKKEDDI